VTIRFCTPVPKRLPDRSLNARYATTTSHTPALIAITAWWIIAAGAPPP
jgi:hypothetical protein